jgi:hypothetical protein
MANQTFDFQPLIEAVNSGTNEVNQMASQIQNQKDATSIGDMFKMMLTMNRLQQITESSNQMMGAAHSTVMSLARNVRGQ